MEIVENKKNVNEIQKLKEKSADEDRKFIDKFSLASESFSRYIKKPL